jgi:hypothetical protein
LYVFEQDCFYVVVFGNFVEFVRMDFVGRPGRIALIAFAAAVSVFVVLPGVGDSGG